MNFSVIKQKRVLLYPFKKINANYFTPFIIKLMRLSLAVTFILIVTLQLLFATAGKGQSITAGKVTIGLKDDNLESAIKEIEGQTTFRFFYRNSDVDQITHLNLSPATRTVEQTLEALLENTPLSFRQIDNNILLEHKEMAGPFQVRGRVVSSMDHSPIANASVFLSNATIGDKTAADGSFSLNNAAPGKYDLVVSIVGFDTYTQTITVNSNGSLPDITVLPKTIDLQEVIVKPDLNRDKYFELFRQEFLGSDELAKAAKISDPEVIDLNFDAPSNTLTGSSGDFIRVENNALGYKIKYLLSGFEKDAKNKGQEKVHFQGSALFEEMKGTAGDERRWKKKREEVYEGSLMHFLRSGINNRLEEDGYKVLQIASIPNPQRPPDSVISKNIRYYSRLKNAGKLYRDTLAFWEAKNGLPKTNQVLMHYPLRADDIIKYTDQRGVFALGCNYDALYVMYNKKHHFPSNPDPEHPDNDATIVKFNKPYALFDHNGGINDPSGMALAFTGAWGKNRIADLLPVDYQPAQITVINANDPVIQAGQKISQPRTDSMQNALLKLKALSDSTSNSLSGEKLYLMLDKSYYALADTIWFKAWLLNTAYLAASDKSGILYIDIANDSSKLIKQYSFPVKNGLCWGNMALDIKEFKAGTVTLRAYTRWMRNFGNDDAFSKTFYITGAGESNWIVKKLNNVSSANGISTANVKLQFSDISNGIEAYKWLDLQVMAGNRNLYKQRLQTDHNGLLDINFKLPEKAHDVTILAENEQKDTKAVIPVDTEDGGNLDVQFLPEGGNLVAGLPAHIGFKAIGEDGRAVTISGMINGADKKQVAAFQSLHNGMGSFDLDVKAGETYTAVVNLPLGGVKEYTLPPVKNTGTILQVKDPEESDRIEVVLGATDEIARSGDSFYLIGRARGIVCYAAIVSFKEGNIITKKIAKHLFPSGIAHFTLMTIKKQPLNERIVYIGHADNLNIAVTSSMSEYGLRDSIPLTLKVTDNTGAIVRGNFSVAVTDDAQVDTGSANDENIISRMLLTADLKGYVEGPGYYLTAKTEQSWQALDDLLITQGWVGYDWDAVFHPSVMAYKPERGFRVEGNVLNVLNKPVKGTSVLLFSRSPSILMDTLTDTNGRFVFDRLPHIDTPLLVLKAVNKNGKSFNVGITVDQLPPPDFSRSFTPRLSPWYVNTDSTLINYTRSSAFLNKDYIVSGGHILKEVKISAKKVIKDSQNLNGPGNADLVFDEKDMEAAGKKTLLQFLAEKIPGFKEGYVSGGAKWTFIQDIKLPPQQGLIIPGSFEWYFAHDKPIKIYVDGISVTDVFPASYPEVYTRGNAGYLNFTNYLKLATAEDIKGVELNRSTKYAMAYIPIQFAFDVHPGDIAFIEITTRGGHGPNVGGTPGMYLYKPLALSLPKEFYKPRYEVKDTAKQDRRSTIDWEPNITTRRNGEARFSFFSAGKPSTYTVTVQGTDMQGNFGFKTIKLNIGKKGGG